MTTMETPILIGLHGLRGVGKDTTFGFIKELCEASDPALSAVRKGFADKMKWAYMRMWVPDITMEDAIAFIEQYKNNSTAMLRGHHLALSTGTLAGPMMPKQFLGPVTFRDHMNQFATESARDIYGYNHWVDILLPIRGTSSLAIATGWWSSFDTFRGPGKGFGVADVCCIADVRAENEIERLAALGGIKVKIKRKDREEEVRAQYEGKGIDVHFIEQGLPDEMFDYILVNDDNNLDNSRRRTAQMMKHIMECRKFGPDHRPIQTRYFR